MAADVLDSSDVKSYLRKFQRASKGKGRIWGLHNYKDVNRRQSKGIRNVSAVTQGQIWLTETGGFVQFKGSGGFKYSLKRAAARTKYMFKLAKQVQADQADLRLPLVRRAALRALRRRPGRARTGQPRPGLKQFQQEHQGPAPVAP